MTRRFPVAEIEPLLPSPGSPGPGGSSGRPKWVRDALRSARRRGGLTTHAADRLACSLGYHPSLIWPDWFDGVDR